MIHVLAIITTKPGKRDEVLGIFRALVSTVRKEQGCIEYGAAIDVEAGGSTQTKLGPDAYMVVEKWDSPEALAAHSAAPHMVEYRAKTKDLVVSRVIHVLAPS